MSTPSDLMNLLHYASRQAVVDGREYYAAAVVLECGPDVPAGIRVYCPSEAWDSSVAGRLAARDAEIARLQDLLRRTPRPAPTLPAPADPTPAPAAPPITLHATWGGGLPRAKLPDEATCPECTAAGMLPPTPITTTTGLSVHRFKAHGVSAAATRQQQRAARVTESAEAFTCVCGAIFPSRNERGGHQRWCAAYQAARMDDATNPQNAERLISCSHCQQMKPRSEFYTRAGRSGTTRHAQPCRTCHSASNSLRSTSTVHTPCPYCDVVGADGAAAWTSVQQRAGHVSQCARRAAAAAPTPEPAPPAKEPAVTAPKPAKAPKAPKPAQEAAPRPLPAPLPA